MRSRPPVKQAAGCPERICSTCRRVVPPRASFCRGCYTVVRPLEASSKKSVATSTGGLKLLCVIVAIASAAWIYRFDVDVLEHAQSFVQGGSPARARTWDQLSSRTGPSTASALGGTAESPRSNDALVRTEAVSRAAGKCASASRLRNVGAEPITTVTLGFSFQNGSGEPLGGEGRAFMRAPVQSGDEATLNLYVPCPATAATVKFRLLSPADDAVLVPLSLADEEIWPPPANPELAISLPDRNVCPLPRRCELLVEIDEGSTAMFHTRRASVATEIREASTAHCRG
jgi:hypothetical protein